MMEREVLGVASPYAAPRTDVEATLARLWSAKLGVQPVGIHDDFFELGGDSLLAADLQLDIDTALGVEIPTWTLFLSPTIAELAEAVAEQAGAGRAAVGST
ncbi:MAG TPA: phosphopantetheine-binding protein [Micromonosporaceae bacterium]|jgi:acyl carrier protein|nr:phosphopantetheine-binding protein [Micromonosporaceae bacterium]